MRIIIDADATPKNVKKICEDLANEFGIGLTMVIDDAHELAGDFEVIKVPKGADSVDYKINQISTKSDIVVTQDYGLAALIMDKTFGVINPSGLIYTKFNIDGLLFSRHMGAKMRNAGKRTKGPKKRVNKDDDKFRESMLSLVKKLITS